MRLPAKCVAPVFTARLYRWAGATLTIGAGIAETSNRVYRFGDGTDVLDKPAHTGAVTDGPRIYAAQPPAGSLDIVTSMPSMARALCVEERELFDRAVTDPLAAELAAQCCRYCPHLKPCRQWFDSLPVAERPAGVVGGVISKPTRRVAKSAMTPAIAARVQARRAKIQQRKAG